MDQLMSCPLHVLLRGQGDLFSCVFEEEYTAYVQFCTWLPLHFRFNTHLLPLLTQPHNWEFVGFRDQYGVVCGPSGRTA
jgi:hypothetical protein